MQVVKRTKKVIKRSVKVTVRVYGRRDSMNWDFVALPLMDYVT